jgi:hypothetical protein
MTQTFIIGLAVSRVKPAQEVKWAGLVEQQSCCVSAATLCLCPSARNPTPLALLLKRKVKPQFERTVKRLSMPFFSLFLGSNPAQFQPSFSVFTVRSAEGYKSLKLRGANSPRLKPSS